MLTATENKSLFSILKNMSLADKALSNFRQGLRYNCAQAVAYAFDQDISKFQTCGGGQAPQGRCGALHAAVEYAPDLEDTLVKAFNETAGSTKCREIKGGPKKYPCTGCVRLAVETVLANKK